MCNIPIYCYYIQMKHLQYIFETFETLAACDVSQCGLLRRLQRGIIAVAGGEAGGLPR
jgi:hypothetical protein